MGIGRGCTQNMTNVYLMGIKICTKRKMNVHPMAIKNICGAGKMDGYRIKRKLYDMVWILTAAKTWNMLPDG